MNNRAHNLTALEAVQRVTKPDDKPKGTRIAIVGGGSIGTAFAVVHARAGHRVRLFDADPARRSASLREIAHSLAELSAFGLLDGESDRVLDNVEVADSLEQALADGDLVHECAPEDLALKRRLTSQIDAIAGRDAVIASASSALTASEFAADVEGCDRCLVAHPGNPPFLLPVIEIVPAPFTSPLAVRKASSILSAAGMSPVSLKKEVKGFVFNRLQGALLREAYCLVRDGVVGVDDLDRVVRDGLGLRWAVIGPFEAVDLNTRGGIERHAALLGPAYAAMGAERGQDDPWTPDLVARVAAERRELLPLGERDGRVRWRDRQLMRLLAARKQGS